MVNETNERVTTQGIQYLIDWTTDTLSEINHNINQYCIYHTFLLTTLIAVTLGSGANVVAIAASSTTPDTSLMLPWGALIAITCIIIIPVMDYLQKSIKDFTKNKDLLLDNLKDCRKVKAGLISQRLAWFNAIDKRIDSCRPKYHYTLLDIWKQK